jgi:hypothetical protein
VFSFYPLSCHNAGECINATFTNLATLGVSVTQEVTDAALLREVATWSVETYTNTSNGLMHFGSGSDLWNISFAGDISAATFARLGPTNLVNVDTMSGSGAVIDSCVFSVTKCNLGRIKTSDTRVTNTTMSQAVGRNLEITGLQVWFEGPVSMNNISISNNTFIGEGESVVHISKAATNITVSGNVYRNVNYRNRRMLRIAPCNSTDPYQLWLPFPLAGAAAGGGALTNIGMNASLDASIGGSERWETRAPLGFAPTVADKPSQHWLIKPAPPSGSDSSGIGSGSRPRRGHLIDAKDGQCLNVVSFSGPDVGLDPCKAFGPNDANEIFEFQQPNTTASTVAVGTTAGEQIRYYTSQVQGEQCLSASTGH